MQENIAIPMDIYESPREIVIVVPLGGVAKKSIELYFEDFKLFISGNRDLPPLKEDLILQQEECYRGQFTQEIQLPPYVYFEHIRSEVTADNILIITVPKALQPGRMKLDVALASSKQSVQKIDTEVKRGRGRPKAPQK